MRIRITKQAGRHRLICTRPDGSWTQTDAGPGLPHHDLAHYVAEHTLGMCHGFFGAIALGRSISELNDPTVIRTLPAETWDAEVLVRALLSFSGANMTTNDLLELVRSERGDALPGLDLQSAEVMCADYTTILADREAVEEGSYLEPELVIGES